jgi:molybdenum storage protein
MSEQAPERRAIATALSNQTLAGGTEMVSFKSNAPISIMPDVNVIKIGGQSFIDRGRSAVFPLVEELVELKDKHKILVGAGGGTRARHAYSLAMEYDMPTGILATIGAATAVQNARILQMVLAQHGGILMDHDRFQELPLFFNVGCIPIMEGMPPFEFWEKPARGGIIPEHRTDSGVYLSAEYLGARKCIFVKDEEGLFTDDPKKNPNAEFIPRISVKELLEQDFVDLVIERVVLEYMLIADRVKEIQIINGLEKGNLTRALNGEDVGTTIYVD